MGDESPIPVLYFPIIIFIYGLDEMKTGNPGDTMQSSGNHLLESFKELMERSSNPV